MSKMRAALGEFVPSPDGRVLVHPQHDQFAYSDGEAVEARILGLLKETGDLSIGSAELMARVEDWPTEYHFSDVRANLLRHLRLEEGMRALELGAGCGAITRFLGERGCEVVAVEGSLLRAQCARERTRDLPNVAVHCSNFQDVAFSGTFDVVTLIGVLEYAPRFFSGDDPIQACLAVARSALAPGGTLVVAIENQLGLKYFAGATEDHLGTHYSGIEDRYQPQGVRTMGRRHIEGVLRTAGFTEVAFQYPFPDYKLPVAVVFEQGLGRDDFRPAEIVRHLYARDYAGKDLHAIDTAQVWPVLEANGLLGDLSNSFLVLASGAAARQGLAGPDELLAVTYSAGRARAFQTQTQFRLLPDGAILCEKTRLHPAPAAPQGSAAPGMTHRLLRDAYLRGPTLHSVIGAALRDMKPDLVMARLVQWRDFLGMAAGAAEGPVSWDTRLPGEYWDCTPGNLVVSGPELRYFDAEWISDPGPRVGHLLLRYLFSLAFSEGTARSFAACFADSPGPAICEIHAQLGMPLDAARLAEFAADANEKNALIFPLKPLIVLNPDHFFPAPAPAQRAGARGLASKVLRRILRAIER
ncbi:MAG: Methyltransferase type 12 [Ramlibacter sp.]|nr:Methyltransferase type 12 [Ramlibacter sp.]